MGNITIREVAKHAGVSVATVSRVINRLPGVRPSTAKRVDDAIAQINYIPNSSARNLKTEKTKMIGLIVSNLSNNHFTSMANIIETVLREEGYSVIICNTDDNPSMELIHLNRLKGLQIDGLILNTTAQNDTYISELSRVLPIVLVDRSISSHDFIGDFVGSNNYDGVRSLTKHLIGYGHRKIGIINSNLKVSTGRERLAGFHASMLEIGVRVDENYPYRYDCKYFNVDGGMEGCRHLMSLENRPTAIITMNNAMAIGVYKYIYKNNISVPDDVSVVSYGDIENSELFCVEPTYATLNPYFIGEKAANQLLSRINNQALGNRETIFQPLLVINESSKPL